MQGKNQKLKYQRKSFSAYFHKLMLILKIDNFFHMKFFLYCPQREFTEFVVAENKRSWACFNAEIIINNRCIVLCKTKHAF
jgi:hypothetical protein